MTTLQELVEQDLGMTEKTASRLDTSSEDASLQKLAAQIGLDLSWDKTAAEEESSFPPKKEEEKEEEEEEEEEQKEEEGEKTSSIGLGLDGLYDTFFPEDGLGSVKVANQEKLAAEYQEYLGGRSFEKFASRWDRRIEKLAVDMSTGTLHEEAEVPQQLDNNRADNAEQAIDTTPQVTDEVSKLDDERTIGDYENVQHSQMKTAAAAAMRKAALLAQLED